MHESYHRAQIFIDKQGDPVVSIASLGQRREQEEIGVSDDQAGLCWMVAKVRFVQVTFVQVSVNNCQIICLGDICPGNICTGGICPGDICPGDIRPDERIDMT